MTIIRKKDDDCDKNPYGNKESQERRARMTINIMRDFPVRMKLRLRLRPGMRMIMKIMIRRMKMKMMMRRMKKMMRMMKMNMMIKMKGRKLVKKLEHLERGVVTSCHLVGKLLVCS